MQESDDRVFFCCNGMLGGWMLLEAISMLNLFCLVFYFREILNIFLRELIFVSNVV